MQAYSVAEEAVLNKNVNFIATGSFPKFKESPQCSLCGSCVGNCPAGLQVNKIAELSDQGKWKEAAILNAAQCIECGSCSYLCRAGRNLASKVRVVKEHLDRDIKVIDKTL